MAEEYHHGLAHGHHGEGHKEEHKDKDRALYWGLGLGAAGLVVAVLLFMGGGNKSKQGTNTVVQPSVPFMPNGTDVSIGTMAAPLYWPALPTSGTPHHPKTHKKHGEDETKKPKKSGHEHDHTTPNDHKGYGKSPTGATHGHTITHHGHNPVVSPKGQQNG